MTKKQASRVFMAQGMPKQYLFSYEKYIEY